MKLFPCPIIARPVALCAALAALPSCGHWDLKTRIAVAHGETQKQIADEWQAKPGKQPQVSRISRNWIGAETVDLRQLPDPALRQAITLATAKPQTLEEIAARIASETGIPVRIGAGLRHHQGQDSKNPQAQGIQAQASPEPRKALAAITYRHSGTLHGLLNKIAARLGIVWRFEEGEIFLTRFDTRIFIIHALPGMSRFSAAVGGQMRTQDISLGRIGADGNVQLDDAADGQEVDAARQNTELESRMDRWEELIASIQSSLSPDGRMSASPSTGAILVTDTPENLARIAAFVSHQNRQMTRQIALNIHVFSVDDSEESEAGLQWDAVFDDDRFTLRLLSPLHGSGVGNLNLGLVRTADSDRPNDYFAGSNAVIKALSGLTNVSTVTSANLVTLNNQPAPVQVTRSTGYLRSVSNVVTGATGVSETTLEPGKITTGFVITVTPRALDQDRILVRFAADLSTLLRLQTQETGNSTIQTPETDERSFLQEVIMRSGQSLVLSGFEQALNNQRDQGLGKASNWLTGNQRLRQSKTRILIVISPTLIGDRNGNS